MNANTLFQRAATKSKILRRQESLGYIEPCLDALAKQKTFQWLGIDDQDDVMACIREMRAGFDTALHHYTQYGRAYIPLIETSIAHSISWFFVAAYVMMTRGGIYQTRVGSVMRGFFNNAHAVVAVSNTLLDLVHDHRKWAKGEAELERVCMLMGIPYQPIHMFPDHDDVLMVANIVGFRRGEVMSCKGYEGFDDAVINEEVENYVPPNVFGLLDPDQGQLLRRSFIFNYNAVRTMVPYYLTVPVPEGKDVEIVHAALVAAMCVKADDTDPGIRDDIREMLFWTRNGRLNPIPLMRSDSLSNRMNQRFGFHLTIERNSPSQMQLLHMVSIFALSLTPDNPYLGVN